MRFLWPEWLWLLLLTPLIVGGYVALLRRRRKVALRYSSLSLLRPALGPAQRWRRHVPPLLALLAMVLALIALARPTASVVLPAQFMTVALAVDVSRSMQATDVEPSRISAAQTAARAFIEDLPTHVRLGLVTFAGTAAVVQTPTENRADLIEAIDRFQLQRGTATGSGLILALGLLFPEEGLDIERFARPRRGAQSLDEAREARPRVPEPAVAPGSYTGGAVILLSDGRRTTGPDPIEVAQWAANHGVRVFTVGFGTLEGALIGFDEYSFYVRLDEDTLKAVAAITGGEYFHAGTAADLKKVYQTLNLRLAMERQDTEISALFAGAALALLIVALTLSVLWFQRGAAALPALR